MKVPLSWIREYVDVKLAPQELADRLTMAGIEVEEIIDRKKEYEKVVIAEVVEVQPHPNADKLKLVDVVTKIGAKPLSIVCGAPNIAKGQKVAVALLGAKLPNGMTIEPRKIRGIASQGMVCAEDELGLGVEHAGTMVLDPTLKVGTAFSEAMGFDDVVLDIAIPANRSDLFSVRGVSFEVAALLGKRFKGAAWKLNESTALASKSVSVTIEDEQLCPLYVCRVIRGVRHAPSPLWLQSRLRAAGLRPVNAVVDATNYIMLEYGEPLHAFDARKVKHGKIIVRNARQGESITTLDGKPRTLDPSMLVIADPSGPIALAGVIGGSDTEISEKTTDIILESAIFDSVSIRKTSRKLGLVSEASHRFEKGLPLELPEQASKAAAALIVELCAGTIEKGSVRAGKTPRRPLVIAVKPKDFSGLLGMRVASQEAKRTLHRLGYKVAGAGTWRVAVPFWRLDVTCREDLVDEVGRVHGYSDLPETPLVLPFIPEPLPQLARLKEDLRDLLAGFGFTETISHAFYGELSAAEVGGEHVEIANPLDKSQQFLRKSIVPQLKSIIRDSVKAGHDVKVFQIGRVFLPGNGKIEQRQPWKLAIGMAFKPQSGYVLGRKLTGVLDGLSEALGVLPIVAGRVKVRADRTSFKGRVAEWCELDIVTMRDNFAPMTVQPTPKYPAVYRDVSCWMPESVQYQRIYDAIVSAAKPLLESCELFDVYEREKKRSYGFHLTFRVADRTLTDDEILAKMKVVAGKLQELGAELR